jgi:hypothetical protein
MGLPGDTNIAAFRKPIKCIRATLDRLKGGCDFLRSPDFQRDDLEAMRAGRGLNALDRFDHIPQNGGYARGGVLIEAATTVTYAERPTAMRQRARLRWRRSLRAGAEELHACPKWQLPFLLLPRPSRQKILPHL